MKDVENCYWREADKHAGFSSLVRHEPAPRAAEPARCACGYHLFFASERASGQCDGCAEKETA